MYIQNGIYMTSGASRHSPKMRTLGLQTGRLAVLAGGSMVPDGDTCLAGNCLCPNRLLGPLWCAISHYSHFVGSADGGGASAERRGWPLFDQLPA